MEQGAIPEELRGARFARAESAISSEIDGEAVILEIESGEIVHLNRLGSRIWDLLEGGPDLDTLCERLQARYDVPPETCRREVLAFIARMRGHHLVSLA